MIVKGSGNDLTNGACDQPRFLITIIRIGDFHVFENHFDSFGVFMREVCLERVDRGSDSRFDGELCQSLPDYRRFF
jgi:hypothetical protein